MQTMYPGMVNSPVTELAAAITAAQTTATVVNGAALPDAPNLAVIGQGELAETIRYTSKSGNSLSGITRGFQGSARAWAAGIGIARNFTEADHAAITANIMELDGEISETVGALEDHKTAIDVHGATSEATANRIAKRDANGQFKVGAPSNPAHVARKQDVDNVTGQLEDVLHKGASDTDIFNLITMVNEVDTRSVSITRINGVITSIEERSGSTVLRLTTLTRNAGKITKITQVCNGVTVTYTINRDVSEQVLAVSKSVV